MATSKYFASLFRDFDGESGSEKQENFNLGFKAENFPHLLTPREAFTVSMIIERMQSCKFSNVDQLENLRLKILDKLLELDINELKKQ